MASGTEWWQCKTIADIENAIQNIQAAIQRTEDYIKEHQF